ncbi:MAG TPA: DUF423 domain-containing protein [Lysobacter sp.]|nr:DUF423 domain-containing protein [Lysobacter sp.]
MSSAYESVRPHRLLAAGGALLAACGVALLAYAAHADPGARLHSAGLIAALHGIATCALAPHARGPALLAVGGLLAGSALFAATLAAAHAFGAGTAPAPFGGVLVIASWLLYALVGGRR